MGRGAKRTRDSDGGEAVHDQQASHKSSIDGQDVPTTTTTSTGTGTTSPNSGPSGSGSSPSSSKRRKVAASTTPRSAASQNAQRPGKLEAGAASATSPEGGSLRRSPRLHRAPDITTPLRKAKKSKSVKFAGKAEVAMFMFGSPPIHQSQPRARFRSPAPNRKTPLRRFPMSPSPMKRRPGKSPRRLGALISSVMDSEAKESNLATTSTSRRLPAPPSSPPRSSKKAFSFPSPQPPRSNRSSSSSSRNEVPPPPPPVPVLTPSPRGARPMDLGESPPPPPPGTPPSSSLLMDVDTPPGPPSTISSTLETPTHAQQQGGARRRSPHNRSRSLSPKSPVIVSALLGARSRSPSLRRASFSSTSSTPTHGRGGDDALIKGRRRSGSVTTTPTRGASSSRRSGKKLKKRQMLSAIDIAAEAVHRQFDFDGINGVREQLKREIQTVRKNTKLQLEKNGVRIFSVAELDKFVENQDDEVGVRTLVDRKEIENLHHLTRAMLRKRLSEFYTEESIQTLTKKYMIKLLRDKYEEDMQETNRLRDNFIRRELNSRGLPCDGPHPQRVKNLREAMQREIKIFAHEEAELNKEIKKVDGMPTLEAVHNYLGQIRADVLREQLKALGLNVHEKANTSPYELAQIYLFRLELYLAVIEKSQLRSASHLKTHTMTTEELEKEMVKRRMHIPDSVSGGSSTAEWYDRVSRLNIALIEDKKKGPVKYDWGSAWFDPGDLAMLTREQMISELESLGVTLPAVDTIPEEAVLARLSQELIARSNKAVEDTLRTELRPFGKTDIRGDKQRLFRALERTYYDHLKNTQTPPASPMSAASAGSGGRGRGGNVGKIALSTTPRRSRSPPSATSSLSSSSASSSSSSGARSSSLKKKRRHSASTPSSSSKDANATTTLTPPRKPGEKNAQSEQSFLGWVAGGIRAFVQ